MLATASRKAVTSNTWRNHEIILLARSLRLYPCTGREEAEPRLRTRVSAPAPSRVCTGKHFRTRRSKISHAPKRKPSSVARLWSVTEQKLVSGSLMTASPRPPRFSWFNIKPDYHFDPWLVFPDAANTTFTVTFDEFTSQILAFIVVKESNTGDPGFHLSAVANSKDNCWWFLFSPDADNVGLCVCVKAGRTPRRHSF